MENLKGITKKRFIEELVDVFIDSNLFGYECNGVSNDPEANVLILDMYGPEGDVAIKLDLSKIGIEFGAHEFIGEDFEDEIFTTEIKVE